MPIETDLNVSPFFDDYNEEKNFHKILFRPAVAVQARELTQLQTILQSQIERFGDNILQEGTIIKGCAFTFDDKYYYIKLNDLQVDGQPVNVDTYANNILKTTANLQAQVVNQIAGLESQTPDLHTLYVKYINTGTGGEKEFANGQTLDVVSLANTSNLIAQVTVANSSFTAPTGRGYAFKVNDGIIYQKGHFVRVESQEIIVSKYDITPNNISIGFTTTETIVNNAVDSTLLDNAQGFNNANAPGAFRLKLTPTLTAQTTSTAVGANNFFSLVDFVQGKPVRIRNQTQYAEIGRQMARRTYEESGDYVVKPFNISSEAIAANTTHLNVTSGTGVAYVDGYRVEVTDNIRAALPKADTTIERTSQVASVAFGNYVFVKEFLGNFQFDTLSSIDLYDTAQTEVTDETFTVPSSPSGNKIGEAKVVSVLFESGNNLTPAGSPDAEFKVFLTDIQMNAGKNFSDVKSIFYNGTNKGIADIVLENSKAVLKEVSRKTLIVPYGHKGIKTLRDSNNTNDTNYVYRAIDSTVSFSSGGTLTLSVTGNDYFPYTAGSTLSEAQEEDIVVIARSAANTVAKSGTVNVSSGSAAVTGSSTTFLDDYNVGDYIAVNSEFKRIIAIQSDASMTVATNFTSTASTQTHRRHFPDNTVIPIVKRDATVSVAAGGQGMTINLGETLATSMDAIAYYNVKRESAVAIQKNLETVWIKIDAANNTATTAGPWALGVADAYKIKEIYQSSSYANTGTDVKADFEIVKGQKDGYYGMSFLKLKPSSSRTIGASDKLSVKIEAFREDTTGGGFGFFSVDSYTSIIDDVSASLPDNKIRTENIPTFVSPVTGAAYDLRDSIDFRPVIANTGAYANTLATATINPANTESFSGTKKIVAPDEDFTADMLIYLPRIDKLHLDSNGLLSLTSGIPDVNPTPPEDPNNTMTLASITVPVYPSLSVQEASDAGRNDYAVRLVKKQNRRYTMRDIGQIDTRIKKLEYYTVLNFLEKQSKDLLIPSASGADRFKNGIMVDPMQDLAIANLQDADFRIALDKGAGELMPPVESNKFDLDYISGSGLQKTGDLITFSYTNVEVLKQPYATRVRNLTEKYWQFDGKVQLLPSYDNFYEVSINPENAITIDIDTAAPVLALIERLNELVPLQEVTQEVLSEEFLGTIHNGTNWNGNVGTQNWIDTFNTEVKETRTFFRGTANENVQKVGDFVTDISFRPYMREQVVAFVATGLRPDTTHYVYFDQDSVSSLVRPATANNSLTTFTKADIVPTGVKGTTLQSDASGNLLGLFYLPADTYFVGDRNLEIADVSSYNSIDTATSFATAQFHAYNYAVEKGGLSVATRDIEITRFSVDDTFFENREKDRQTTVRRDPLAQTFIIDNDYTDGQEGIYVTQVDLYFKEKSSVQGLTVNLTSTDNGYPTNRVMPFGSVHLKPSQINVSETAATATTVTFESPVFLRNNTEYAIALIPDANSPDYKAWTSEVGQTDVGNSAYTVRNDWGVGVLFQSTNNSAWQSLQSEDLKFTLRRASFNTGSGTATLQNGSYEYITANSINGRFTPGEYVYQDTANLTGNVSISSSNSVITGTSTTFQTDYAVGDYITLKAEVAGSAVHDVLEIDTITSNTSLTVKGFPTFSNTTSRHAHSPTGKVFFYDSGKQYLYIESSTAANSTFSFGNGNTVIGVESTANCIIQSVDDKVMSYFQPMIYRTTVTNTSMALSANVAQSGAASTTLTQNFKFNNSNYLTKFETAVMSKSNEIRNNSSAKTFTATLTMTTADEHVSPVLDLQSTSINFYEYLINNDSTGEDAAAGNAQVRYISRIVELEDDLDAEDLKVYVTAYRPAGTDVEVYGKFLNAADPDNFSDKAWTKLDMVTPASLRSSSLNRNDFFEYEYKVPNTPAATAISGVVDVANNSATVTGSGTTFSTDLAAGDIIKIINTSSTTDYQVSRVASIANNTSLTLSSPSQFTKTSSAVEKFSVQTSAFADPQNAYLTTYFNDTGSKFETYKTFAIKIVLKAEGKNIVPRLRDMRAIALSV